MKILLSAILFSFLSSGCTKLKPMPADTPTNNPIVEKNTTGVFTYLALGDSYTIGEAVQQNESFPYQLKDLLVKNSFNVETPKIIAKTGWTTDELQNAIVQAKVTQKYDFVTLLIGVNNQYRGYSLETYKKEFSELLETAIGFADGKKTRVFVVSIPDWGATPFGKNTFKSPEAIAKEIDAFNAAAEQISTSAGVSFTNITPYSRVAKNDPSLVANDGLHPSGKMYANWASSLESKISSVLK